MRECPIGSESARAEIPNFGCIDDMAAPDHERDVFQSAPTLRKRPGSADGLRPVIMDEY
jgi:hypothetical protein